MKKSTSYGKADITRTPLGTRVTIYAMKPGIVIGRRGENVRELTRILEQRFGLTNPQVAVAEIEIPEFNPNIMASKIASDLKRGIHFRRAGFWTLNRIMEAGAQGVEIVVSGKLRSRRHRFEKFRAGYIPKSGDPAEKNTKTAIAHVQLKPGIIGVKVSIIPKESIFPDRVEIAYPVQEILNEEENAVKSEGKEEETNANNQSQ
jgi:small subunit ribosomal protein S3